MTLMLGESDEDPWCQQPIKLAEKTVEVFSNGLCATDKGDLGEIAASLYGLFCGDICRHHIDKRLRTYSVSFDSWLAVLHCSGTISIDNTLSQSSVGGSISFMMQDAAGICDRVFEKLLIPSCLSRGAKSGGAHTIPTRNVLAIMIS